MLYLPLDKVLQMTGSQASGDGPAANPAAGGAAPAAPAAATGATITPDPRSRDAARTRERDVR